MKAKTSLLSLGLCIALGSLTVGEPSINAQTGTLTEFDNIRLEAQRDKLPWFCDWRPLFSFHEAKVKGTKIRYYRSAMAQHDQAKPTLLAIHGTIGGPEIFWEIFLGRGQDFKLAELYDVIVIELPGHGTSTEIPRPATFQHLADIVAAFLDQVGAHPIRYVCGTSYGGEVAFRTVALKPLLYNGLVLIDSSGFLRPENEVSMLDNKADSFIGHVGVCASDFPFIGPLVFRRVISWSNKPNVSQTRAALEEYYGKSKASGPYNVFTTASLHVSEDTAKSYHIFSNHRSRFQTAVMLTQESVGRDDKTEVVSILGKLKNPLRSGRLPVVLVWGEYDPFFTYKTQASAFMEHLEFDALTSKHRDRLVITVKNAGHCVAEQQPEKTASILHDLCQGLFAW